MTKNGSGSFIVSCPAVTCRSCMASSSAACVFGGVRLISSASTMLAKIGPRTNRNSRFPSAVSSRIVVPVMSDGIRSGVNWMRLKVTSRDLGDGADHQRLRQARARRRAGSGRG